MPFLPSLSCPDIAVPGSAHAECGRSLLVLVSPARVSPPRRKGGREEGREGEREGGREGERRKGGREEGRERERKGGRKGGKEEGRKEMDCMLPVVAIVGTWTKLFIVGANLCLQLSGSGELRLKMLLLSLQSKQPLTSALQLLQRGEKKESMKQYLNTLTWVVSLTCDSSLFRCVTLCTSAVNLRLSSRRQEFSACRALETRDRCTQNSGTSLI